MSKNKYGLDHAYQKKKLEKIISEIECYTPDDLARALFRLGVVAAPGVLNEKEFVDARLNAIQNDICAQANKRNG